MTHRILVVDDEPDIMALVAYHLAKAGFRVSTASNGPDALKSAREERPDIVILDLMLPGVSGYDVLAELRRRDETKDVGVILLTARREETDRIRGLSLGADDYLTKPFCPQELSLRVAGLLRRLASPPVTAGSTLAAGPISIDRSAHRASVGGQELQPDRDRVQAAAHAGRAAGSGADAAAAARDRVGGAARHPDAHGGHARAASADQAGRRREADRDGARLRLSLQGERARGARSVNFGKRLVVGTLLVLVLTMAVLLWAAERSLRRDLEGDVARALENEARLIREALPADSLAWSDAVSRFAHQNKHRITLVDSSGRVRADSDVPPETLPAVENHAARPEVRAAIHGTRGESPAGGVRPWAASCSTWRSRAVPASSGWRRT